MARMCIINIMNDMNENAFSDEDYFDSDGIKLSASEPLSSNSYIYIDLEPLDGSVRANRMRQQQYGSQQVNQKKQKRKGRGLEDQTHVTNRGSGPALHVILENEAPYDEYTYEPEIPSSYAPDPWSYQTPEQQIPYGPSGQVPSQYQQQAYPNQAYQPFQQMQPGWNAVVEYGQPEASFQHNSQPLQPDLQVPSYSYPQQPQLAAEEGVPSIPLQNESHRIPTESISADGKVVRRPWNTPASSPAPAAHPAETSFPVANVVHDVSAPIGVAGFPANDSIGNSVMQADSFPFDQPVNGAPVRGMMSWKKGAYPTSEYPVPEVKEFNSPYGFPVIPITVYDDVLPASDIPEAYLPSYLSDFSAQSEPLKPADVARPFERQKPAEKPLKINIGSHGRVSTQDHLTISRETIEEFSREQEVNDSPVNNTPSKGRPSGALQKADGVAGVSQASSRKTASAGSSQPKSRAAKSKTIDSFGVPLLDEISLDESYLFEFSPTSLSDGIKTAEKAHKKRKKGVIAAIFLLVLAALIAGVAFLHVTGRIDVISLANSILPKEVTIPQGSNSSSSSASRSSSSGKSGQAGNVIYEYTATTSEGIKYKVKEKVTFSAAGECESTEMELEFANAADLDTMLINFARDYGNDYKLVSQNGNRAVVTINISSLKLDREEYEDALRYSVEDLMIVKK